MRYALGILFSIACMHKISASETIITSLADNGLGTLREAMLNAQDGDFLIFSADLSGTIALENNLPDITARYSIQGPEKNSVAIDGDSLYQIFMVNSGDCSISNLHLINSSPTDGGTVYLQTDASLKLTDVSVARHDSGSDKLIKINSGSTFSVHNLTVSNFSNNGIAKDLLAEPDSVFFINTDSSLETDLVFKGATTLVKQGKGSLKLYTTTTEDITITVSDGSLIFNGATLQTIIVQENGFLSGSHSCFSLINHGIMNPGNSIGTIQTTGDYNQSGTLQIELSPSGASDLLEIGGNAFLDGSLVIIPESGLYLKGDSFTILTTGGNIQGHFNTASSIDPGLNFSISESAQSIQVTILQNSITLQDVLLQGNSLTTLDLFQNASSNRNSDLFSVMSALNTLDSSHLENALNQLDPNLFPAVSWSEATTLYQIVNLASNPFAYCDHLCREPENSCCPPREPNRFWTKALGERTWQAQIDQLPGFRTYSGGILVGYDQKTKSPLTLGCYGAYVHSNFQWKDPDDQGNVHINGYNGSLYASVCSKYFQADFSVLGSFFQQEISRLIAFNGFHRTAYSSPDGHAVLGHFGGYGIFPVKRALLSPFGKIDYISIWQHGFHESGASSIDLIVPATQWQFIHAEAGLYSNGRLCFSWGTIIPSASLSWVCFAPISGTNISGSLKGIPQTFTVKTSSHKFNAISPMIELGFITGNHAWISAAYKGEFSIGRTEQDININFKWQF